MMAIELCHEHPYQPADQVATDIIRRCHERGLLVIGAGTHKNVIRVLTPLTIDDATLDRGLGILEQEILAATRP